MVRVGVLGGTFDPVHNGHLAVAEEARIECNLSKVLLVPAAQPWLKGRVILPAEHRLEMLRLAVDEQPHLELSSVDIERAGPSYTIDTITDLRSRLGSRDEIYFILGWDSLAMFPLWRQAKRIIELCYLLAAPRPGYSMPDLESLESAIPGVSPRIVFMGKPCIDISATEIRRRVSRGLPITRLVPKAVARYIEEHGLYRD